MQLDNEALVSNMKKATLSHNYYRAEPISLGQVLNTVNLTVDQRKEDI